MLSNEVNCTVRTCVRNPKIFVYGAVAMEFIQVAIIILTLTGVINKTGFLIGSFAIGGIRSIALGVIGKGLGCCNSTQNAAITAIICFVLTASTLFSVLRGGMHYKSAAWVLAGVPIFTISSLLISYGCKKKVEDDNRIRLPC